MAGAVDVCNTQMAASVTLEAAQLIQLQRALQYFPWRDLEVVNNNINDDKNNIDWELQIAVLYESLYESTQTFCARFLQSMYDHASRDISEQQSIT